MRRLIRRCAEACTVVAGITLGSWMMSGQFINSAHAQSAERADRRIEEVVVSARRRTESLEGVPVSTAVFTPDMLREQNITTTDELGEFVPSLQIDVGQRATNANITIRGIGGAAADPTQAPGGVGVYVNGVFLTSGVGNTLPMLDIERIEVLRGPQGTLFGKNTTAGAINIITRRPQPEMESEVLLRTGSHGRRDARVMVNAPINDQLYSRVAIGLDKDDGYYENLLLDEDRHDRGVFSSNLNLRWLAGDQWTFDFTGMYVNQQHNQRGGDCRFLEVVPIQTRFHEDQGGGNFEEACRESEAAGKYKFFSDMDSFVDVQQYSTVFESRWESDGQVGFFDQGAVSTNLGWRKLTYEFDYDRDYSREPLDHMDSQGEDMQTASYYNAEVVFEGDIPRGTVIAGVNYFGERAQVGDVDRCHALYSEVVGTGGSRECKGAKALSFFIAPFNQLGFGPPVFATNIDSEVDTYGVFGDVTYDVRPWLELGAGVRWTSETRAYKNVEWNLSRSPTGFNFANVLNDDTVQLFGKAEETWSKVTPTATIGFHLPRPVGNFDTALLYLKWARGFNSGGFNTELATGIIPELAPLEAFDPETVDNYEIGLKATMFDSRLSANFAAFVMQFEDKQESVNIDNESGEFGADPTVQIIQNAAEAEIKGFELELVGLIGNFQVDAGLAYQDPEFTEFSSFDPVTRGIVDLSNQVFNNEPEWTFTGNVQYVHPLAAGGEVQFRVGTYYQSSTDTAVTEVGQEGRTVCFQESYWKHNARTTWISSADNLRVSFFGRNLGSEDVMLDCGLATGRGIWRPIFEDEFNWGLEAVYQF